MALSNKSNNTLIKNTILSLEKHNFDVKSVSNKKEALDLLIEIIPKDSVIGYGGSQTLEDINFFTIFNKDNYPNILDRRDKNLTYDEKQMIQKKALTSDFFVTSVNALSVTGELILIDKWGNRVAAVTYGPQKRIFAVGKNKITKSLDEAMNRAKNLAAVSNNIRLGTKNPCTKAGICKDCDSIERICAVTTIIHRCQPPQSVLIILVNEDLGF